MKNDGSRAAATRIADALIVFATGLTALKIPLYDAKEITNQFAIYSATSAAAGLLAYIIFPGLDVYRSWRGVPFSRLVVRTWCAFIVVWTVALAFLFFSLGGVSVSRRWAISWFAYGGTALWAFRVGIFLFLRKLRKSGFNSRAVALVGYGHIGREVFRRAASSTDHGYQIEYILKAPSDPKIEGTKKIEEIHTAAKIIDLVHAKKIDEIWITLSITEQEEIKFILRELRGDLVKIRWIPDIFSLDIMSHKFEDFLGFSCVHLNAIPSPGVHGILKNAFDRAFALAALVALCPLFIVIATMVKLSSPGPIFFRQPRLGQNGQKFLIYKFRTMKVHQESGVVTQARKGDSRVTKIGEVLRKTSLDELPQFINVLLGDMSVVGPRPHAVAHGEFYTQKIDDYMLRHMVKPGITGWAQINGWRGETDTLEKMVGRIECDVYYIKNWSFLLDIKIIWRTVFSGWTGKNAY